MAKLRHEKLSFEIRGAIFDAHNEFGMGWSEEVFHQALAHHFEKRSLPCLSKPRNPFTHRGIELHVFQCDFLIENRVILELKALPFTGFAPAHYSQLIHYLKTWQKDLGFLVNFGKKTAQIQRLVWDEPEYKIEDFAKERGGLIERIKEIAGIVMGSYGLGYPDSIYRSVLALEFAHYRMACEKDIVILNPRLEKIGVKQATPFLLVDGQVLVKVTSLMDGLSYFHREQMQNFGEALGITEKLFINFGKRSLQFHSPSQ